MCQYFTNLSLLAFIGLFVFSCTEKSSDEGIIVFDYHKEYPEINLKLSNVADVRYIKLGGLDSGFMVVGRMVLGEDFYVDKKEERIYTTQKGKVLVYDMDGNPIRMLDKEGRGPQEYMRISRLMIDEDRNSVKVYSSGTRSFVEYDTLFNFKRATPFDIRIIKSMMKINGDTLLLYNQERLNVPTEDLPTHFFLASESTSKQIRPINIYFERPIRTIEDGYEFLSFPSLIKGKGGIFLTNKCCDTVFWMDRKTLEVTPRFVDITNYNTPECMTIPSYETDDYIFLETNFFERLSPHMEHRYYVYDKNKKQIFRLKVDAPRGKGTGDDSLFEPLAIKDQCALTADCATLSEGYMALFLPVHLLHDNMDRLPTQLKEIAMTIDENDNPVLMLIKLK